MVSVALGMVIILSAHHSFDSWDEQIHYNIAYTDSQGMELYGVQ